MNIKLLFLVLLVFLLGCRAAESRKDVLVPDKDNGGISLPEGFSALVVADNLGHTRHLKVADNGDIYASLSRKVKEGGIVCLRDTTNDGRADLIRYTGAFEGTGIGLHDGYLYFGADNMVVRYRMTPGKLLPDTAYEVIASGFEEGSQHRTKPFTFDEDGNMYVTVGAPSNACMEQTRTKGSPGMDPCPLLERFGGIWKFKADQLDQDQLRDGVRYATGIRNAVAIHWNKKENKLYALQHGRDQLHQFFPELYDEQKSAELPAEEFLLVENGSDFGWPYCYYDQIQNKKVLAPEYGGDGNEVGRCQTKDDPILAFPGHTAPNDLLFYTGDLFPEKYKNGAFIAFHGSWNRSPHQEGYHVVFVPFEGKIPSGNWEVFADGFAGEEVIPSPGSARFRPCGLAQGPDGSLFVADDVKGRIWRIFYKK